MLCAVLEEMNVIGTRNYVDMNICLIHDYVNAADRVF
jgi:hypothetical protein